MRSGSALVYYVPMLRNGVIKKGFVLLGCVAALGVFTACGDDDDDDSTPAAAGSGMGSAGTNMGSAGTNMGSGGSAGSGM